MSLAQKTLTIKSGTFWNETVNEFEIWLDGQAIGYAADNGAADRLYHLALRTRREHAERCPDDIPFMGEPMVGPEPVRECDEYGLEARA